MMNFLGNLLGGLLRFVYDIVSNIGTEPEQFSFYAMAIIITTIIFKLLLLPIGLSTTKNQKKMSEIQPKMKAIQDKYKNDPQTMQIKMSELYKEEKYNPASSCLPMLIQLPIIFAFFKVMREPATFVFKEPGLYEMINKTFLWIPNLENPDHLMWGLPLLAALTTFLQSKTMPQAGGDEKQQSTMKMMNMFLPVMIFFAARNFAAGLALYWVLSNMFTIGQQLISNRTLGNIKEEK
ncbi:MAG TPA: YidC/Oxa1 family membrane protein insertase [Tissierellaceae bacterium]|nr:YidC/Oxa1 family membrane protein insertase [Tissierellaceae bacterium]